jgi:hypothetical protein
MARTYKGANQLVEDQLGTHLHAMETALNADCLCYSGPIAYGADDDIREAIEEIGQKRARLVFILETTGGFAETTRRIADTLRHHYEVVDFLVPSYAMSAGTILVMSGDAILMDYYSILGPIDPQIEGPDGKLIPALGYLVRYEGLLKKAKRGKLSQAELDILLDFDQGQLYSYEQARDLSSALLEEWLCKYKWKNWKITETHKRPVTDAMKRQRAREIAKKLSDVQRWNSHGIGINMPQLIDTVNLKITDFGADKKLNPSVRSYHKLLTDYMGRMRHRSVVHTREEYRPLAVG